MRARLVSLVTGGLALLVALVLSVWALLLDGERMPARSTAAPPQESPGAQEEVASRVETEGEGATTDSPARSVVPATARSSAADELVGRVVVPPGTPQDELIVVVVRPMPSREGPMRVQVDEQRRFRVPLDDAWRLLRLDLEAPSLLLEETVRVNVARSHDEVVLEPLLAGRIVGRVDLPPGGERWRDEVIGAEVVGLWQGEGRSDSRPGEVRVDESLRFEGRRLRPGPYTLTLRAKSFHEATIGGWDEPGIEVGPGETVEVVLRPRLAAVVRGTVRWDPDPQLDASPACVETSAWQGLVEDVDGREAERRETVWAGELDEDGSFLVGPLLAGSAILRVVAPGHLPIEVEIEALEEGEERDVGTLMLQRGATLKGRLLRPDGTPVGCGRVLLDDPTAPPRPGALFLTCGSHSALFLEDVTGAFTDDDGAFEIAGLGPGPWSLFAEHREGRGIVLTRFLRDLRPSPAEVTVVLERAPRVTGVVLAADGAPFLERLSASARCEEPGWGEVLLPSADVVDGRFELVGLFPGGWRIVVGDWAHGWGSRVVEVGPLGLEVEVRLGEGEGSESER